MVSSYRHCRTAVGVLGWLVAVGSAGSCALGADYRVYVVTPTITNHMVQREGPLPPVCREADVIELSACRGEYEPASFVVDAATPLEAVRIEVGELTGPGGTWARDCIDVRVVKEYYTYTGADFYNAAVPMLLVHDESFLGMEPDPKENHPGRMKNVAKGELRDSAELLPVDIETRKQFWITVHVPKDAEPGSYEAAVRVVPGNGKATELTLRVEVRPFELLPPMIEYSLYYPAYLNPKWMKPDSAYYFVNLSDEQCRKELKNMLAHGVSNPNIYTGVGKNPDGSVDFSRLERLLEIRESVGMPRKSLYLISHPIDFQIRPLKPEERNEIRRMAGEIKAWTQQRGYPDVFLGARDEAWGDALAGERDSMVAVHDGGAKVFVAVMHTMFYDRVGDVLHRPVMGSDIGTQIRVAMAKYDRKGIIPNLAEMAETVGFHKTAGRPGFRKAIDGIHRQGRKVFTYMNPVAGLPLPELQRRNEGLGLWRTGFDGTMTWAYTHIQSKSPDQPMIFAKVYRTDDGVLDTVYWEGYREGVDDVRYLTTLFEAARDATGRFPQEPLVAETYQWLAQMDAAKGDLDTIRNEMAQRTIALMDLGYRTRPIAELLAEMDLDSIEVVTMPQPWQFKIDTDDHGVKEGWFNPTVDDANWAKVRSDVGSGWEKQGFGGDQAVGFGWYRAPLPLTDEQLGRTFKYLYFEAADEESWVYVNGAKVFENTIASTGRPAEDLWLMPFIVPLAGMGPEGRAVKTVDLKNRNLLAVRVYSREGMGGIWKPVHLILSDEQLSTERLAALIKHRQAKPDGS